MARPIKQGLDFFNVGTNMLQSREMQRLKQFVGVDGAFLYLGILSDIYGYSYYRPVDKDYVFDLAYYFNVDESKILEKIHIMVEHDFFDARLFHTYQILTSAEIQEMYLFVKNSRRNKVNILPKYALPIVREDTDYAAKTPVTDAVTPDHGATTPVSAAENTRNTAVSTQSKGKKKVGKETKGNESKGNGNETEENEIITPTLIPTSTTLCAGVEKKIQESRLCLLNNETWLNSVILAGGKRPEIPTRIGAAMETFERYIESIGESQTIQHVEDYSRRFKGWWGKWDYQSAEEIQNAQVRNRQARDRPQWKTPSLSKIEEAMLASQQASEMALQQMKKQY